MVNLSVVWEEEHSAYEQHGVTDVPVSAGIKKPDIRIFKRSKIVPLPPGSQTEYAENPLAENSSQKSVSEPDVASSSKRKLQKHKTTHNCFFSQSLIALGVLFVIVGAHAFPEVKRSVKEGSLITCCYKWNLSADHIVKLNGKEVGMCNHGCHKTDDEDQNGGLSLRKEDTTNILKIKATSCASMHVTVVLTGNVTEATVLPSNESCEDTPKHSGSPAANAWIWKMVIIILLIGMFI